MTLNSKAEGITAYRQVANLLKARLFNGDWAMGERLPTLDVLATDFNVSRMTLRQSVKLLVDEGLLKSTPGIGTFVTGNVKQLALNAALDKFRDDKAHFNIEIQQIDEQTTMPPALGFRGKSDGMYVRVSKRHLIGGIPCATMHVYVEQDVFKHFPPDAIRSDRIVNLIRAIPRCKLSSGYERIEIVPMSSTEAAALNVPEASLGVRMTRQLLDNKNRLVFASVSVYQPNRFFYEQEMTGMVFYGKANS